jgi:hypothetical protein
MQPHDTPIPQFIQLGPSAKDMTGQRFGRLLTIGPVARNQFKHIVWLCQCDCGNMTEADGNRLRRKRTQSCGCLHTERTIEINTTHGMRYHHLYGTWKGIIFRCTNPRGQDYASWGGRGITMHAEWRHDFKAFHDHVSGLPNYGKKGYSLDRIDNDGNYEPGNVRWATQSEQNRNTRATRYITFNGETKPLVDWAETTGIKRTTIARRLKLGWTLEKALTQKVTNR